MIGFEGIYDFVGLNSRFDNNYVEIMTAAYEVTSAWDVVLPIEFIGSYEGSWKGRGVGVAMLGRPKDDVLLDEIEIDGLAGRLRKDGVEPTLVKELNGGHDEIWEVGDQVVDMVLRALGGVFEK